MGRQFKYATVEERKLAKDARKLLYYASDRGKAARRLAYKNGGHVQHKNANLRLRYGITLAERDTMFAAQGAVCAACGSPTANHKNGWVVDHDHKTGIVRGIVCHPCNIMAGHAEKRPSRLAGLRSYLGFVGNDGAEHAILSLPA